MTNGPSPPSQNKAVSGIRFESRVPLPVARQDRRNLAPGVPDPGFLAAATDDTLVNPQRNTQQLADKLKAAGVPVTLKLYPHASHTTIIGAFAWPLRWIAPVLEDVEAFIAATPEVG